MNMDGKIKNMYDKSKFWFTKSWMVDLHVIFNFGKHL